MPYSIFDQAGTIFEQAVIMFLIILVGVICYKTKLVTEKGSKELSGIILKVVNPAVIFMAYQRDFEPELLKGLGISFLISSLAFAVNILLAYLLIRKKNNDNCDIERFSSIYSNCGFMGIPLVNALLGLEGVFYLTAYITTFNLLVWTHGVIQISGKKDKKSVLSAFRSPSVIAIFVGLLSFILRAFIPKEVSDAFTSSLPVQAVGYIKEMNTPLAMIVAGVTIARTNLLKAARKPSVYYVSFIKLLLVPAVATALFCIFKVPQSPMLAVTIATAAPTATMATLFALRYDKNYLYCSELFAITTLLSIITMPLIILLNSFLTGFLS